MDWTSYLFGFNGRINRARMWFALLIVLVCMLLLGLLMAAFAPGGTKSISFAVSDVFLFLDPTTYRSPTVLGLLKVPVFMFQGGHDPAAEPAFREIARLTGGAWCRFDPGAAAYLRELLRAAAPYAAGGREGLLRLSKTGSEAAKLIGQMK